MARTSDTLGEAGYAGAGPEGLGGQPGKAAQGPAGAGAAGAAVPAASAGAAAAAAGAKTVRVNSPLRYKGYTIYQQSWSADTRVSLRDPAGMGLSLERGERAPTLGGFVLYMAGPPRLRRRRRRPKRPRRRRQRQLPRQLPHPPNMPPSSSSPRGESRFP